MVDHIDSAPPKEPPDDAFKYYPHPQLLALKDGDIVAGQASHNFESKIKKIPLEKKQKLIDAFKSGQIHIAVMPPIEEDIQKASDAEDPSQIQYGLFSIINKGVLATNDIYALRIEIPASFAYHSFEQYSDVQLASLMRNMHILLEQYQDSVTPLHQLDKTQLKALKPHGSSSESLQPIKPEKRQVVVKEEKVVEEVEEDFEDQVFDDQEDFDNQYNCQVDADCAENEFCDEEVCEEIQEPKGEDYDRGYDEGYQDGVDDAVLDSKIP